MEIDINNININDDLEIVEERNLLNTKHGNILNKVDNKIENVIFDLGLDKYLLTKNRINGGEMKSIVREYKEIFKTKKYHTPEIINHAYEYVIGVLKNSYVYKDNLMVTDGNYYDAMSIISKLYEEYENKEEFVNLNNFMNYYNEKEIKLSR